MDYRTTTPAHNRSARNAHAAGAPTAGNSAVASKAVN